MADESLAGQLRAANPWWELAQAVEDDPHIRRVRESRVLWEPPVMAAMSLKFGDTHVLRGPRQAGKTTTLKRLIERLIQAGERRVLYFSFDAVRKAGGITEVIRLAKKVHPASAGPWYIFLDEITSVEDWQYDLKHCWDSGLTSDDSIVLTASSARDLRLATERLPGRRGRGRDFLQLPLSFRDFCLATGVQLPRETLPAEEWLAEPGRQLAGELFLKQTQLQAAFEQYRQVGGFPAAVRDLLRTGVAEPDPSVLQILWSTLSGDLTRFKRDPLAGLKLLEQVGRSLGSALKWTNAAESMDLENPTAARQYAELLSEIFVLQTLYFWDIGRNSLEPKKQRKVYFVDPLYAELPRFVIPGTRVAEEHGMVENLVAAALFRSAAFTLIQAHAAPGAVGYWRSTDSREIDFVVPRVSDRDNPARFPIEVKGDNDTQIARARSAIKRTFNQGIVVTRAKFDWNGEVAVLPVWMLLAGLTENVVQRVPMG